MEPSTLIPLYIDSELDITIMALFTLRFFHDNNAGLFIITSHPGCNPVCRFTS